MKMNKIICNKFEINQSYSIFYLLNIKIKIMTYNIYSNIIESTLAKLSTIKEKSKYTRYLMDLYCTEEETIHNALSGLFKTKVLFQKKYNILWVVNISTKNNRIVTDNIIPIFVSKVKYGYRMTPIPYPFLKDMYRVKDAKYMAYVIGKHGIADFTLTDESDFPVFEENDNLDNAIIFTSYEDDDYMYYEGTRPEDFGELGDGYMI